MMTCPGEYPNHIPEGFPDSSLPTKQPFPTPSTIRERNTHMADDADDLFGDPISTYSDKEAIEDGILVAIPGDGGVNRVTRTVFDEFVKPIGDPRHKVLNLTPLMDAIRAM